MGSLNQRRIDQFKHLQASSSGTNKVETRCKPAVTRSKDSPDQTHSDNDSKTENEVVDPKTSNYEKSRKKRSFADSTCSCKQKCVEKINNEKLKTIYMQHCSMDKENQKVFSLTYYSQFPPKRSRTKGTLKKTRVSSRIYLFKMLVETIQVCSKFFIGKLVYKKHNVTSTIFNNQSSNKSWLSKSDFPN